jgi:hypothetical protein
VSEDRKQAAGGAVEDLGARQRGQQGGGCAELVSRPLRPEAAACGHGGCRPCGHGHERECRIDVIKKLESWDP